MMEQQVLIIGGGAIGMMAAITAAEQGATVTLLEKNDRLGKKMLISGKAAAMSRRPKSGRKL